MRDPAPVQVTGQGSLSPEMKMYYDRTLLERALPVLIHRQFAQSRPVPRNNGKSVEFRKFAALPKATTPLTEGVTPTGQSLSVSAITASIQQIGDYVSGSDVLTLTAFDPILTETAQLLGEQAGESLDAIARTTLNAGTNVQYANGRTARNLIAAGDNLTVLEIRKAVRTLKKNKARPVAGTYYVAFVGPSQVFDLQSDPNWTRASEYAGSEQIFAGEIGRLYGVRFIETTETMVFVAAGAAGIDVHSTLVLGANAYGSIDLEGGGLQNIVKALGSAGTADPLDQRWTSGWKAIVAFKILNDLAMVRIESSVSG